MTITFDTLAYAKKLKQAGVPERQAEVQAEALADIVDERLATKQDIAALKRDIESLRIEMKELDLRLRYDLTVRLGAMVFASAGLTIAVLGWLIRIS